MTKLVRNRIGAGDIALIVKTVGLLIVLLFVITLFFAGGVLLFDRLIMPAFTNLGAEVELPDIVEKDFYAARNELTALGLELEKIEESFHDFIDEGFIIEQTPPPFTRVKRGRTVGAVVSRGPQMVIIPDLTRLTLDQARTKLQEFQLLPGSVVQRPDTTPEGTVIEQTPAQGVTTLRNTRVNLIVSSGPATTTVMIPRLVSLGLPRALEIIRDDLKGRVWIDWEIDETQMHMTVIGQTPEPGIEVEGRPIIDLRVAIRSGFMPTSAHFDTTGIGAPPPWLRRGGAAIPPIIPSRGR